jgi:hypothetical protein
VERAPTTGGGIIARRRQTPDTASRATKEKPALERDKPPREITDKAPSPTKSQPTPLALSDEPTPAPKSGPAVFKLSDEPPPPSKEARMAPTVKEKAPAPAPSGGAKPIAETKRSVTAPPAPKSGPAAFALADEPTPAPKSGPAVFKLSDEPPPPSKEARMAPTVKTKAGGNVSAPSPEKKPSVASHTTKKKPPVPSSDKSSQEARADKIPPAPKSGPATFALRDEPTPAPKSGPAVFKLSDEPPPPSKEARMAPTVKEKAPIGVGDQKREGLPGSTHKPTTATPKLRGDTPAVKHRAPAPGKGDDIPVLEDAVAPTGQPSAKPTTPLRSKAVEVPKAEHPAAKEAPGSRNLAVQVVAKLNTELRKCGERALSPATVDRLQYLLREVLERGSAVVDNSHKKR